MCPGRSLTSKRKLWRTEHLPRNDSWRTSGSQRCAECRSRRAVAGGWLLACPPVVDDHVVADAAGYVVVQAEADDAVIAG